eukprot:1587967-Prymnesium_polylepis.1
MIALSCATCHARTGAAPSDPRWVQRGACALAGWLDLVGGRLVRECKSASCCACANDPWFESHPAEAVRAQTAHDSKSQRAEAARARAQGREPSRSEGTCRC